MTWIHLLFPILLISPIVAVYHHDLKQDEDNKILTGVFWTLVAIGALPIIYVYLPSPITSGLISKIRQRLEERRLSPLQSLWSNVSLSADMTQVPSFTPHQTQQVFSLMRNLMTIPVLKIREVILTGIYTQEAKDSKEKESQEKTLTEAAQRTDEAYAKARSPLAMEIIQQTVQPVYDNPFAFAEPQKYEKTGRGSKSKPLQVPWTASYSGHAVFEISDRFPAHHNDNKFRVAFDVWNRSHRKHFVIFGVGPELPAYCKRVFELKEMSPPEFHATDPLIREMEEAGIHTYYYQCSYKSQKFKADKRRSFLLAFHNIPIEDDHPFSSRLSEIRRLPFVRMMLLAHQLDAPVFCADPEVHLLLSLLHTSLYYIFHSPSTYPKVLIDAIDLALDRMEVTMLWPPDAIHLFGLLMIDFCGKFMEEKISELGSQQFLSYHFMPKKKPSSEQNQNREIDKPPSIRQCLDAYTKSTLEVGRVVEAAKTEKLIRIDWKQRLLDEAQFLGYAYNESTYFSNVAFEHYYFDLQPSLDELRYRREERETEYDERRSHLETAVPTAK